MNLTLDLGTRPKNLIDLPEGSVVRSIYSNKVYVITKHFTNGMCNLLQPDRCANENWNACNNQHFIPADFVNLGILCLI